MSEPTWDQEAFHLAILDYLKTAKFRKSKSAFETESGLRDIVDRQSTERQTTPNILQKRWRATCHLQLVITALEEKVTHLEHQRNVLASILGMKAKSADEAVLTPQKMTPIEPSMIPFKAGVTVSNSLPIMAVHSSEFVIRSYSTNSWTPLPVEDVTETSAISAMSFAPDGVSLIVATAAQVSTYQLGPSQRFVQMVSGKATLADPIQEIYPFRLGDSNLRWSFVTRSRDLTFQVWSSKTNKVTKTLLSSLYKHVRAACVATRGLKAVLVLGLDTGCLSHWSLDDDDEHAPNGFEAHQRSVDAVCPLPATERADYVSAGRDCNVRLWLIESHTCIAELTGHNAWIRTLVSRWDGKLLISASDDGFVKHWNVETGKCVGEEQVGVLTSLHLDYIGSQVVAVPVKGGIQASVEQIPKARRSEDKNALPTSRSAVAPKSVITKKSSTSGDLSALTTTASESGPPLQLPCPKNTTAAVLKETSPQKKPRDAIGERLRKSSGFQSATGDLGRQQSSTPSNTEPAPGSETQRRASGEATWVRLNAQRPKPGERTRLTNRRSSLVEPSPRGEPSEGVRSSDFGLSQMDSARQHSAGSNTRRSLARDFSQRQSSTQGTARKATAEDEATDVPLPLSTASRRSSADTKRLPTLSRHGSTPIDAKVPGTAHTTTAKPTQFSPAASPNVATKRTGTTTSRTKPTTTTAAKTTTRAESELKKGAHRSEMAEAKTTRARPESTRVRHGFSDPLGMDNRSPASTAEKTAATTRPSLVERGAAYASKKDPAAATRRNHA